ncbi:MAG: manganese-dependent inorganic pyrophosphatase [Candidatus Andersenbacteria bacterium]|nr:manganese-dependent inorganic pyrophosphatase [Candidatus Andersenbacteria bacterium]
MKNKIISIGHKNPDTDSVLSAILVSKFGKKIFGLDIEAVIANDINNETKFVLDLLKLKKPRLLKKIKNEKVIMVDTTEPKQIIDGLTEDNLIAVIDHHNLGGLRSSKPIYFRVEPIGCTGSVIYKILQEKNIKIDKKSAVLMITCIVSDTLNFNSPTTTKDDKKILKELNKIAKLDVQKFVRELFAAKSSLKGISIGDIISKDYKQFDMGKYKVGIGVWETTDPAGINLQKDKLISALIKKKKKEKMDYMFFAVIDIVKNNSYLYIIGNEEEKLAKDVFGIAKNNIVFSKGTVSRKKQLVPPLMNKLGNELRK